MNNWYRQVHKLQVDMTSYCNARCGACIRNIDGGETRPGLKLTHFDVDVWKRMATVDTKGWWIRELSLNGNWGDTMMHPHLVEMLEIWITAHPETFISIATNGSMRSTKFWAELAKALRQTAHHKIDFAVDGMEDTHHIYRRKTSFSKLTENIKSFCDAGGNGNIQMTMFEHNKHQIEEVKELARELGIRQFTARRSFTGDERLIIKDGDEEYTIKGYYPTGIDEHQNYSPPELQIDFEENDRPMSDIRDSIWMEVNAQFEELYMNYSPSKCPWKNEGKVQIDPWGTVWPCCHISTYGGSGASEFMSIAKDFNQEASDIDLIANGQQENNLHNKSLADILRNDWFNETVDNAVENADWSVCRSNCGVCK